MAPRAKPPKQTYRVTVYMYTCQVKTDNSLSEFDSLSEAWDYAEQYQLEHDIPTREVGRWFDSKIPTANPASVPARKPTDIWHLTQ